MTDRMAKVRAAKREPQYKNVHEDVPRDDSTLSLKNVKEWEKHNKDRVKDLKYKIRRMDKNKEQKDMMREVTNRETFLSNIRTYFDSGVWLDLFYGKDQEHKTQWRTLAYAYDTEAYVKTTAN